MTAGEMKHTATPWTQSHREKPNGMYSTEVYDSAGETIATIAWYPVERDGGWIGTLREANAAFIVQAVNAHDDLVAVSTKVRDWLLRLAETAEQSAKDTRFVTLSEANAADAKNYRAVIKEIDAVLAKATP